MAGEYIPAEYTCPAGGHPTPFFVAASEKSAYVRCPVCGAKLSKRQVPRPAIIADEELYELVKQGLPLQALIEKAKEKGLLPEDFDYEEKPAPVHGEDGIYREDGARPEAEAKPSPPPPSPVRERPGEERRRVVTPISELFQRPKGPCEVLQEVLEEFSLRPEFTNAMVRRCERKGGLHPVELLQYLLTMKSGIKSQGEAAFIAEEYADALRQEYEKAQQLNMPYPSISLSIPPAQMGTVMQYPEIRRIIQKFPYGLEGMPSQGAPTPPAPGPGPVRPGGYPYQYPQRPGPGPAQQAGGGDAVLANVLAQLIGKLAELGKPDTSLLQLIMQMQQQQQQLLLQMIQAQQQGLAQALGQGLQELGKNFSEALRELSNMVERALEQAREKQADPEILYKAAKAEAEKEYLEKLLELQRKQLEAMQEQFKKIIEEVRSAQSIREFESDTARLTAQALQQIASVGYRLIDVIDKRRPVELAIRMLPDVIRGQQAQQPPARLGRVETEGVEEELAELERLGLVEEAPGGPGQSGKEKGEREGVEEE